MSDVVLLQIIQTCFWLLVIGTIVLVFRRELKRLLQSLSSLEVAGAKFHLKDRDETLRSYVLLAETLIDLLSRSDRLEELWRLMYPSQIESLGAFALKYTAEVAETEWNEELLKNIAFLLGRFGRYKQSIALYDVLLGKRPDHVDLLNLKALALMTSRLPEPVAESRQIFSKLTDRYPEYNHIRFNYALALSLSKDEEEAYKQMSRAIQDGYPKNANPLEDPLFQYVRENRPDLLDLLRNQLESASEAQPVNKPDRK